MQALLDRLKEPSSWAGLSGILTPILLACGVTTDPGIWTWIAYIGAGAAGLVAFVLREKSS